MGEHTTAGAMYQEDSEDYVLQEGRDNVWVTVSNISVNITRREDGVSVALYPLHQEMNDCIAETWATWGEAAAESEEVK